MEEGLHVDAEGFVVAVDAGPGGGFASQPWAADTGQDGCDAGNVGRDLVSAGPAGFGDQVLAAQLAQVVGALAAGVVGVGLSGHGVDLGGELGDGEAAGCGGQGQRCRQCGSDPGLVHIDPADSGGADLAGQWELVEEPIADESDIDAVQRGGEPVDHTGEPADDLGEAVQDPPAAQLCGVVDDRFEAQHMLAFGIRLQRQAPEVDLEQGQVIPRCLDHGCEPKRQVGGAVAAGALLGAEQGPQRRHVQP
ncbi:MAG: hypothetical protein ACRDUV_18815 [Pseudonocardiaceae bacterium]